MNSVLRRLRDGYTRIGIMINRTIAEHTLCHADRPWRSWRLRAIRAWAVLAAALLAGPTVAAPTSAPSSLSISEKSFRCMTEMTHIGHSGRNNALGTTATLGSRVWIQDAGVRLHVGPLDANAFARFLPDGAAYRSLAELVRIYAGSDLTVAVRLILRPEAVQSTRLGASRVGLPTLAGQRAAARASRRGSGMTSSSPSKRKSPCPTKSASSRFTD